MTLPILWGRISKSSPELTDMISWLCRLWAGVKGRLIHSLGVHAGSRDLNCSLHDCMTGDLTTALKNWAIFIGPSPPPTDCSRPNSSVPSWNLYLLRGGHRQQLSRYIINNDWKCLFKKGMCCQAMVAQAFNASAQEAGAGRSLRVRGQLVYIVSSRPTRAM